MKIIRQISSLHKARINDSLDYAEIYNTRVLKGERFSYQIAVKTEKHTHAKLELRSSLAKYIKIYSVQNAVMDAPVSVSAYQDIDYITKEPGLMPDVLVPLEERDNIWMLRPGVSSVWVEVNVPKEINAGNYEIEISVSEICADSYIFSKKMTLTVIDKELMPQSLIYTRWFYVDCIADYHNVEIYSNEHWKLIEEYIKQAVDVGINMILVPVHTPPLDTAVGTTRPCVQLVDIKKNGDKYIFSFEKFKRFIDICKKCGVEYYEIAHMFSQWGAKYAPNIKVEENGKCDYMFGWNVKSDSKEYIEFLKQYIAAISDELNKEGIGDKAYFHISDEPTVDNMESYKKASDIIRPLISESKTFDALSEYEFYEKGLVECPVTCVSHINEFLKHEVKNQWVYYCCEPQYKYPNCFMAMPLYRVRIIGFLMYKYNIKGFLQWGLNFYNAPHSRYKIDPYVTTSADGCYPSGDPFILYPSKNGAYNSIRGKVTFEAIEDMNLCRTLEQYIGKAEVIKIIDDTAGFDISFDEYPRNYDFIIKLRNKLIDQLESFL